MMGNSDGRIEYGWSRRPNNILMLIILFSKNFSKREIS